MYNMFGKIYWGNVRVFILKFQGFIIFFIILAFKIAN